MMITQSWDITVGLHDFYVENANTFFINTKLDTEIVRSYEYTNLFRKLFASSYFVSDVAVIDKNEIVAMGILYPVEYLSNYFGVKVGVLDGLVVKKDVDKESDYVYNLLHSLMLGMEDERYDFLSCNVPSDSLELIKALEAYGFYYAEGFNNMCGRLPSQRKIILGDTIIREAYEEDFTEIEKSYLNSDFPSHLVTDPFFDEKKAKRLYVQNFRNTWENNLGKVWVATIDMKVVGALIGKIDERVKEETGIVTNARSGMGIIVDPKYREQAVAQELLNRRESWYEDQGVEWQILGANISNVPMIRLLEKKGFRHASTTITMHKRF